MKILEESVVDLSWLLRKFLLFESVSECKSSVLTFSSHPRINLISRARVCVTSSSEDEFRFVGSLCGSSREPIEFLPDTGAFSRAYRQPAPVC